MSNHINLVFFDGRNNFGDQLNKPVLKYLLPNHYSYSYNKAAEVNLNMIGSYIHEAKDKSHIFGSGIRSNPPLEGPNAHRYQSLIVHAV